MGPNNSFHFYGFGEWKASLKLTSNYVEGHQMGPHIVAFPDGTKIEFGLPKALFRGLIRGDRIIEYEGTITFTDEKNGLKCALKINPPFKDPGSSSWFRFSRPKKPPTDYVKGKIVSTKKGDKKKTLCKVGGTWMGCLEFDGEPYWHYKDKLKYYKPIIPDNPLPSDSRFRMDLVELQRGNIDSAQEWKTKLENKQRREKALREDGRKARGEHVGTSH